ncbi:MAG: GTP cyclohydrolase II [Bacteroidetes bacterium]|nr:MAG: GTP cyclohydrolase II [Bacteroidota bacterium]
MKRLASAKIPTHWGVFEMISYADTPEDPMPHLALVAENFDPEQGPVLVRLHSECMTGDLFGSKRCDCGEQLDIAMTMAAERGGVVIYLRQEGRGIGLTNKLKAYQLQDQGLDTVEANTHLGFEPDARHYEMAIQILQDLGVREIELLTNNPEKIDALEHSPVRVVRRIPIVVPAKKENARYLHTKKTVMGHLF